MPAKNNNCGQRDQYQNIQKYIQTDSETEGWLVKLMVRQVRKC